MKYLSSHLFLYSILNILLYSSIQSFFSPTHFKSSWLPCNLGSNGVETVIQYLNSESARPSRKRFVELCPEVKQEMEKENFWSGGNFVVEDVLCTGVTESGLLMRTICKIKNRIDEKMVLVKFPMEVKDEISLKVILIEMSNKVDRLKDTAEILKLPFGYDYSMPLDLKFNNVPHSAWVRAYLYDSVTRAVVKAVQDDTIPNKSRLQLRVNYPEVNPAFDTYRIGTLLEMVRSMALALTEEFGLRVRICVQQSLGEGTFQGLPLALASMRMILEKMDWGTRLSVEQRFQPSDNVQRRSEALIRVGSIGAKELADDDDVILVIAPQNGGMIINYLDEMATAARGRPMILINPSLDDRPSSNNMMQIRGRSERRVIKDSFQDIYALRLLYPSYGGYMYPIKGMIAKQDFHSPWIVYNKEEDSSGREVYDIIAGFPPQEGPDPNLISNCFLTPPTLSYPYQYPTLTILTAPHLKAFHNQSDLKKPFQTHGQPVECMRRTLKPLRIFMIEMN